MFIDPLTVSGDLGVSTRVVSLGAAIAPGHDTSQTSIDSQRTARVTLASVLATDTIVSSADLSLRYTTVPLVNIVAQILGDDRYSYGLQLDGRSSAGVAPASDDGLDSGH